MNIYLQDVAALPDPKEDRTALSGIPGWRRDRILKFVRPCDRKLSLGAWRLLEKALASNGISADTVTISPNGKPECSGGFFNLSHSADMVLCVVSDRMVGCDIEKVRPAPLEVARHYFSKREQRYLAAARTLEETNQRFFRLWTMKESYLKMTGEGLRLSPVCIEIDPDTLHVLRDAHRQPCTAYNCSIDGYEISICTDAG